jgi:pyrroloquinoline quinone biosynthesis protein B
MRVHLLGTAAGGGFPQWNCACRMCATARREPSRARPRTQASVAVSADGVRWFLINASPDIRTQIEAFEPLQPRSGTRGSGIHGVLLTTADLDHTLGLFVLREGQSLPIHSTAATREALTEGLTVAPVMQHFCGTHWLEPSDSLQPLCDRDCRPSGLSYAAFSVPGKPPRYRPLASRSPGDAVGYRIVDEGTGGVLVVAPDVGGWNEPLRQQARTCGALLIDGTFWMDDDMPAAGVGTARAGQMAHWPLSGAGGTLSELASVSARRLILIHINNTNPILLEDSPERRAVETAGITVGWDGLEFSL